MTSLTRQVLVELRRAVDTRAPRWAFIAFVSGSVALCLLVPDAVTGTFEQFVGGAAVGLPLLTGLLAVMVFTADWSTRAALFTFVLTPNRRRVIAARYLAVFVLTVFSLIATHVIAAVVFTAIRPDAIGSIFRPGVGRQLWEMLATGLASSLTAMAVAGLVLRTVPALLIAVFAPLLLTVGLAFTPVLLEWLNPFGFASWFAAPTMRWAGVGDESVSLGPAATSFLLWTAVPLVLGWFRQMRAEPR